MALKTDFNLEYNTCGDNKKGIPVIIVAGGSSNRMNGIDKIFTEIKGIPVIIRTMMAFERSECCSQIIVAVKKENILKLQKLCQSYMITKLSGIVAGGNSRAESVLNALNAVDENTKQLMIHDGARPFVSRNVINSVAFADEKYNCVVCATNCTDTVKMVKQNIVDCTPDRSLLVNVQTPQRLNFSIYKNALELLKNFDKITDDASVMEDIGEKVLVVDGDIRNIKITSQFDLKLSEIIMEEEYL